MRALIFTYEDEVIEYRIKLLRESVWYLRRAEREARVELAHQMKIVNVARDRILLKHMTKINQLIIVYDGVIEAHLPSATRTFVFDKFPTGSSFGLYSLLVHD